MRRPPALLVAAILAGVALGLWGCAGLAPRAGASGSRIQVVAAENFWGSIAAQLGGSRISVHSVIVDPATDPHAYEPTSSDAIALASAKLAIVNGIGYDGWASRLLAADGSGGPAVLNVGDLLGLREGANPHQWYSPTAVATVIAQITTDLCRIDRPGCAYFRQRRTGFETRGLGEYHALIDQIRRRFAGVPVGYSESIFAPLGRALGLRLMTPPGFAAAVAEGAEVTAGDLEAVDGQAQRREIAVWVYNRQNATPDVQRVSALARRAGIPIATVTETLSPASASFQAWQTAQLRGLELALHRGTGR